MDINQVVLFLAPFIPILASSAGVVSEEMLKKIGELGGEKAWNLARGVWSKLKAVFSPKLKKKAEVIACDPQDIGEIASFAEALLETLREHPELADEVLAVLGGHSDTVHTVIATNESWIHEVIHRGPGRKTVLADKKSRIGKVVSES